MPAKSGEVDWGKLLRESQNDVAHIDTKGIPPILKPLPQLAADARRLAKEHPKETKMQSQAAILFGKGGVDIEKQPRHLEKDLFRRVDPSREVPTETDLGKCLEQKHQTLISSAIEESTKLTENSFRNFYMNKLEDDWDEERKAILERLGFQRLRPAPEPKPAAVEDVSMAETALVGPSNMTLEQRAYAETVLNLHRTETESQQRVLNAVQAFRQAAILADNAQVKKVPLVQDCWNLVAAYVDSLPQPLKSGNNKTLTKHLIQGALRYLEDLFIKIRIGSSMQGGSLAFIPKAQSFLKASNTPMGEMWEGSPFWPLVFVCFRCGHLDDAVHVARKGKEQGLSVSGTFVKCLETWKTGKRLDEQSWKELRTEYDNFQGDVDKHKAALFVIIGRFKDLHNSTTFPTVEDYMWFQLHMIWEGEGKLPDWLGIEPRKYTLSYLQETLRSFGVAHFSALYYKVLLLSQQFEQAVCYLINTDCAALAVHLGIALQRLGLLHCFYEARPDLLSGASSPNPKVNFLRIIKGYIEPFKRTNPEEAFMYLLFLRDIDEGDEKERGHGKGLCRREITNLILQTRDFDTLVGKERPAQTHHSIVKSGCVYRWCGVDAQSIIIDAGKLSEEKGNLADALKLFSLAEKNDLVAGLLIKEMGRVLTHHRDDRDRKELYLRATQFLRSKALSGETEDTRIQQETLSLLVHLTAFFNQYEQRLYSEALTALRNTVLLPQSIQDIEGKVNMYEGLDPSIRRHMEEVVEAALECLAKQPRRDAQATQQASALSAFKSRIHMKPYNPAGSR